MTDDALRELVLRPWGHPHTGVVHDRTPERLVELLPNYPVLGANCVALVRCAPERVDAMVDETRAFLAARGASCHWILDDEATPADLDDRLVARGMTRLEDAECMVLPAAGIGDRARARPDGVELVDGLRDAHLFREAEAVLAAAFDETPLSEETLARRFVEAAADRDLRLAVAMVGGTIAGAGWTALRPGGVLTIGTAVHPDHRGGSVYRALMAERARLAVEFGAPGCASAAAPGAARILGRMGYRSVGRWRRFDDGEWETSHA
jgi:hypothetical protein